MNRGLAAVLSTATAVALTVALTVTGCSAAHPAGPPPAAPAGPAAVAVHATLTDTLVSDRVEVLALVRAVPPPAGTVGTLVLVQIRAVAGDRYLQSIRAAAFALLGPDGTVVGLPAATATAAGPTIIGAALSRAGRPPLPGGEVQAGQTGTGWLAFRTTRAAASLGLTLRYERPAFTVVGSSIQVPASILTAALPVAERPPG